MSTHGASRPSCGSQALPTKTATRAAGGPASPASCNTPPTPSSCAADPAAVARWYSAVSACVLPPPNCVTSVITGDVFAVFPASRRSTMPVWPRSARVKQVRAKNARGSR